MANWPFDHYKRWNIEYSEEESFQQFKYRMNVYLGEFKISSSEANLYNFLIGSQIADDIYGTIFPHLFRSDLGPTEYANRVQALFELHGRLENTEKWETLAKAVDTCLDYSPDIGIGFHRGEKTAILYPKGAELLDDEIVNRTLLWLNEHPKVLQPYETALKLYMEQDENKRRNLLDNLRFAIEQLLKEILQNNKSLENQQKELGLWLKGRSVHQQVINLYNQLLFGPFRQYQNDAVKHAGEYRDQDIEFMIYLAGTFMRLLLQLEKSQ